MIEYELLTVQEIEELRRKEARGELTQEDTMRFIQSTRARFLQRPVKAPKAAGKPPAGPKAEQVDFF